MEYYAIFTDEELNQIGNKQKFKATDEFITFKKGTFNIRLDAYLYRDNNYTYYIYIYPTDEKLLIDLKINPLTKADKDYKEGSTRIVKIKEKIEKGDLKLIVGENIIGQLAHMAVMGLKENWLLIIIIAVSVGIGMFGIGYSVAPHTYNIVAHNNVTVTTTPLPNSSPIIR
jgi:hypothetical protein